MKYAVTIAIVLLCTCVDAQDTHVDPDHLFEQSEAAINAGKYNEALVLLDQCLKAKPGYIEAYHTRAIVREQLRDLPGALTDYSIYLEKKPDNTEVLFGRATVAYQLGRFQMAREDFTRLLKLPVGETNRVFYNRTPSVSGSRQIMTLQGNDLREQLFNYLGLAETKLTNYKAAIVWLDSAIAENGKEADYFVNRGIAHVGLGDTATALQDYEKALKLSPEHTVALYNIAILKRKKVKEAEAVDPLEKAIESDSSMLHPYLERAYLRMEGGYYKGALEDYDKALRLEDRDPNIWMNRGLVKEKLNDLKGAFSDYTQAITLKEDYDKAWLNRGNVLNKQGRYKEAIEDYTVAITYNATYAPAFYNRAIARQKNGQTQEACEDLKQAEALGLTIPEKMKRDFCEK